MCHRFHAIARALAAGILVSCLQASTARAEPGARGKAGSCAAFAKRIQDADRAGLARPDLYDGLSGWIALKSSLDPGDVDALARTATPDALACGDFGLFPEVLRTLESVVAKLPADQLRPSTETCLAGLRLLDELAEGPHQAALRALASAQAKGVGRLLGFLARDRKPAPGAVEARLQAFHDAGGDLRTAALGPGLSACEPLGVDVGRVRQAYVSR